MVNSENFYPYSQLAWGSIEAVVLRGLDPDGGDDLPLKVSERCHSWVAHWLIGESGNYCPPVNNPLGFRYDWVFFGP